MSFFAHCLCPPPSHSLSIPVTDLYSSLHTPILQPPPLLALARKKKSPIRANYAYKARAGLKLDPKLMIQRPICSPANTKEPPAANRQETTLIVVLTAQLYVLREFGFIQYETTFLICDHLLLFAHVHL